MTVIDVQGTLVSECGTSPVSRELRHQPEAIQNTEAKTSVYHMSLSTAASLSVPGRQPWSPPRSSVL